MPQAALKGTWGTAGGGAGPRARAPWILTPPLLHLEGNGNLKGWGRIGFPKHHAGHQFSARAVLPPQGTLWAVTIWECI